MHIIEVIPISRGISKEELSYFTGEDLKVGSIIDVPLRKKTVPAIVTGKKDALEEKASIRSADFQIKKIGKLKAFSFFLPEFIESAKDTSYYFGATTGAALSSLISVKLLKNVPRLKVEPLPRPEKRIHQKYIVQAPDEERFANYKSFIREEFAKKSSVFFCLPTIHDIKKAKEKLEKGIEEYTHVLHSSLGDEDLSQTLQKLSKETHPVLILGTGSFLSFPRGDLGAIIIDRENSLSYKAPARPFLDFRIFAEILAKKIGAKFVMGDLFIDVETLHRYQDGEFQELSPLKFRSLSSGEEMIIDMRKYKTEAEKEFVLLSDELKDLIQSNKENNENMYIYTARKGLAPSTICGDCGEAVKCENCEAHMILHGSKKGNFFLCHRCGERRNPKEVCKNCGSWKLITLGIGAERIEEKIKELFPGIKIFVINKDKTPTHNKALGTIKQFYSSPGSLLLGTEMTFPYLDREIGNAAVGSLDSLFSIPDFRINEKIMGIILKLRSIAQTKILLQTRNPEQKVFEYGVKGNLLDFYRDELTLRKKFNYPPFSVLIKISVEGAKNEIVKKMSAVKTSFENGEQNRIIDVFPSFIKGKSGKSVMHALLRIPRKNWPDSEIVSKIRALPPEFTIKVDPDSLL